MVSEWQDFIPDSLLFEIFSYLDVTSLGRIAQVCQTWLRVSKDELLWQGVARRKLKINSPLAPGKSTWKNEVKRLLYHVPTVCVETIRGHTDEVLDVAISHNGRYFCTCSRDAHIVMWNLDDNSKSSIVSDFDAGHYLRWQLSQYSIFNPDDTLIMNCGVKNFQDIPEDDDDTQYLAGIGAVLTVPDLVLVSVVEMDPPTMFGAWINEWTYISGSRGSVPETFNIQAYKVKNTNEIQQYLHVDSTTSLSNLTKMYEKICDRLFTFRGNYNHLMNLLVANVPNGLAPQSGATNCDKFLTDLYPANEFATCTETSFQSSRLCDGQIESHRRKRSIEELEKCKVKVRECSENLNSKTYDQSDLENNISNGSNAIDRFADDTDKDSQVIGVRTPSSYRKPQPTDEHAGEWNIIETNSSCSEISLNRRLYIAFVTGNHDEIAVHDVTNRAVSLYKNDVEGEVMNQAGDAVPSVDKMDHIFSLKHCYITGLCLSHDHRYLYFNYREIDKKNPANKIDSDNEFDALPTSLKVFCKELKIGSIDLVSMTRTVDIEFSGHVGYSSWPAWYICLDASPDYVGSGSEDMRGYIWDRHYGVCVGILSHSSLDTGDDTFDVMSELMDNSQSNVVNGLAFCPIDQEICITVCDDKLIKIWKSKNKIKQIENVKLAAN